MTRCPGSLVVVLGLLLLAGCGGAETTGGSFGLQEVISKIIDSDSGSTGTLKFESGALPPIRTGLAPPLVIGETETLQAGAVPVRVRNLPPGTQGFVVFARNVEAGNVEAGNRPVRDPGGHYTYLIPVGVSTPEVSLSIVLQPRFIGHFDCMFALLVDDAISEPFDWPIESRDRPLGDFQVTVTWDTDANLNLHVEDPFGDAIAITELQSSRSCGALLYSSTGANTPRSESIGWPTGVAPAGDFLVGVAFTRRPGARRPTAFTITVLRRVDGEPAFTQTLATGSFPYSTEEAETPYFIGDTDESETPFFIAEPDLDPVATYDGSPQPGPDGNLCGNWVLMSSSAPGSPDCTDALDGIAVTIQQVGETNEGAALRFVSPTVGLLWEGTRNGTGIDVALPLSFSVQGETITLDALALTVEGDSDITGTASIETDSCSGTVDLVFSR